MNQHPCPACGCPAAIEVVVRQGVRLGGPVSGGILIGSVTCVSSTCGWYSLGERHLRVPMQPATLLAVLAARRAQGVNRPHVE